MRSTSTRNTIKPKNHFAFSDCRGNRIECFTNLNTKDHRKKYITLRTGKFRISRNDNDRGARYFINDLRELNDEPNAVAVFDEHHLELVERHDIKPAYVRDDLSIYFIGEYHHPNIKKKLIITDIGIHEEIVRK